MMRAVGVAEEVAGRSNVWLTQEPSPLKWTEVQQPSSADEISSEATDGSVVARRGGDGWRVGLALIVLAGFVLRLILLFTVVQHPGVADPNHYYNMAVRLRQGQGLTIDYVWQYNLPPESLTHPEDHWMPLTAVLVAGGMAIFSPSAPLPPLDGAYADLTLVRAALVPLVLLGSALPLLTFWMARRLRLSAGMALFAAGAAAFLPEFVLNSLRTDTTIPAAVLVSLAVLCLLHGLERTRGRESVAWFSGAGVAGGLAYLTRSDAALLLPLLVAWWLLWWGVTRLFPSARRSPTSLRSRQTESRARIHDAGWRWVWVMPVVAVLVVSPYLVRNVQAFGRPTTPEGSRMFFYTHHDDHYAYARAFNLNTMLAAQTPGEIIGKRVFEMVAGVRQMQVSADVFAPLLVGGLIVVGVQWRKQRADGKNAVPTEPFASKTDDSLPRRGRVGEGAAGQGASHLLPALLLLLGAYIAYTVFIPYKAQAGSFKKAYLMTLPLLLPLAGWALEYAIANHRIRHVAAGVFLALAALNAFALVREDAAATNAYVASIQQVADAAFTLPDVTGDGESDGAIILMTQDPYMLRYVGLRSVMYPYEPLDTIDAVAQRYGVDYLLMPANRPALDPIFLGEQNDARFTLEQSIPGTTYQFWRVNP